MGIAITIALLAWTLHDVQPAEVLADIRRANLGWLLAAVIAATLLFPLRTFRWQVMLRGENDARLSWWALWHAVAIGFMANNLLPARAGEFARAYVANRQLPVRFPTAFASIAVERVLDGLVMLALLALAVAAPSFPTGASLAGFSVGRLATGLGAAFTAALVLAFFVAARPDPWLRLLRGALRITRVPKRFADRLVSIAEGLVGGLAVLRRPGRFAAVIGWSLAVWLTNGLSFWLCFRAFGIALPFEAALLLQAFIGFGVAVPSSPGFWGVFEFATKAALAVYGIDQTLAVSYAVAYHITTFAPITLLGLYSLARLDLKLGELRGAKPPTPAA